MLTEQRSVPRKQTNLKLSETWARRLDIQAAMEQKDKATIVEEALEIRSRLMGEKYADVVENASTLVVASDPRELLNAVEALRRNVPGASAGGSVSVTAVLAKLRSQGHD